MHSAVSAKNSSHNRSGAGSESSGLYQPKFTKKNIDKSVGNVQSQVQKPMPRRMSSHEFRNGMANEADVKSSTNEDGYYMKNSTIISALAQKSSGPSNAVSSSITHQQFLKQSSGDNQTQ